MKRSFFIIVVVCFLISGAKALAEPVSSGKLLMSSLNFLIQQRVVIQASEIMNLQHIYSLQACLCQQESSLSSHSLCRGRLNEKGYQQKYFSMKGELAERSFSCEPMLKSFIYNPLKQFYSVAKQSRALMQPQIREDDKFLSEVGSQNLASKIDLTGDHPQLSALGFFKGSTKSFSLYNEDETEDMLRIYQDVSSKICRSFASYLYSSTDPNWSRWRQYHLKNLSRIPEESLCRYLLEFKSAWKDLSEPEAANMMILQQSYVGWAAPKRMKFRQEKKQDYFNALNKLPLIVLVSQASPGPQEILEALGKIQLNALQRQKEYNEWESSNHILGLVKRFEANNLNESEKNNLSELLEKNIAQTQTLEMTKTILTIEGKEIEPGTVEFLQARVARKEWHRSLWKVGAIVAANMMCLVPVGRAVGAAAQVLLRSGCMVAMGVPLNAYFLAEGSIEYRNAVDEFLSTPDGKYYIKQINQLQDSQKAVALSFFMLPVGASVIEGKTLLNLLRFRNL